MLLAVWFMLLLSASLVWGQFPAVCNTPDNLNAKECCPNDCSGRGNCGDITDKVMTSWDAADQSVVEILRNGPINESWPFDVRYQWPLRVFERVCNCSTGWGGYDCSRCDFGYVPSGNRCVEATENQLLVRKNFSALSFSERREYINVIRAAKHETEMKWAVVVGEPARTDSNGSFELQNVSTYDMLVTMHALSAREQENNDCKTILQSHGVDKIDFAHENSTFLTWHRYYLLIVESELRRVAEGMNITDFTLPYWDWQVDVDERVFNDSLFGTPFYSNVKIDVSGTLFDDWPTVCDQHYRHVGNTPCSTVRSLCNVNEDRARSNRLQRGKFVENDSPFLPDSSSIIMALSANNNDDQYGFRNRLEGFVDLCPDNNPRCITYDKGNTHNNLHNAVHIFLGGHMRIVPSASNDPIFFLHHANVDRLFESWIRKAGGNPPSGYSMYETGGHPGHNLNDYLVPFFPLKTNADMYKRSSELGFHYDMLQRTDNLPLDDFLRPCHSTCLRGGYHEGPSTPTPTNPASSSTSTTTASTDSDSSNSVYHIQLYLLLFGVATASIFV